MALALASVISFSALQILPRTNAAGGDAPPAPARALESPSEWRRRSSPPFRCGMSQALPGAGKSWTGRGPSRRRRSAWPPSGPRGGTAHELNTRSHLQILRRRASASAARRGPALKDAEGIRRQVQRGKEIISNMLAPPRGAYVGRPRSSRSRPCWRRRPALAGRRPGPQPKLSVDTRGGPRPGAGLAVRAFEQRSRT